MKKLVVISGAGISKDSGIKTFREAGGLWEEYKIEDICSTWALENNLTAVLDFYNLRRKQVLEVEPNLGHLALVELEKDFDVEIITQNIDDLHERAGSTKVLHLHGEITKCQSMKDPLYVNKIKGDIKVGDLCPLGGQLRPFVVFFGENVPNFASAAKIVSLADILIIVGTSLDVSPANTLINYIKEGVDVFLVDPGDVSINNVKHTHINKSAEIGLPYLQKILILKK